MPEQLREPRKPTDSEMVACSVAEISIAAKLDILVPELFTDPDRAEHVWTEITEDDSEVQQLLAGLGLAVEDEQTWLSHYLKLTRETMAALRTAPLRWARDTGEGSPSLHPLLGSLRTLEWPWRAAIRRVFVQCRNALRLSRDHAKGAGVQFRSAEVEEQYCLSLDELDVLIFLLHHTLAGGSCPEGRDILRFMASHEGEMVQKLPLIDDGVLVLADLISTRHVSLMKTNVLTESFVLTADGLGALRQPLADPDVPPLFDPEDECDGPSETCPSDSAGTSELGSVTKPEVSLDDVILSEDVRDEIKAALMCVDQGEQAGGLLDNALFGRGKACTILLHGPPGTGKTITAQAIANELNRPLLNTDWSSLGSALWWETENRLGAIFQEAVDRNAVLLLDEIDMLNKRSNETHGGQPHINRLVNVLLVKLENAPSGAVIILCTNLVTNLDPAIDRRLTARLLLGPAETEEQRNKLWQAHLKSIPLDCELTEACSYLAQHFPMLNHGGHIKQCIQGSVRKAIVAGNTESLTLATIEEAAQQVIAQLDLKPKTKMGFGA